MRHYRLETVGGDEREHDNMSKSRRHQLRRLPHHLGGVVSVTPIRDRSGEQDETFSVSWHSQLGDLRWLSPRIPSHESADVAAQVLSDFTGAVKR
jgi:hypothetical protein